MEKYRKYGDAATGINPFVLMRTPTTFSVVVAAVLFPLRLAGRCYFCWHSLCWIWRHISFSLFLVCRVCRGACLRHASGSFCGACSCSWQHWHHAGVAEGDGRWRTQQAAMQLRWQGTCGGCEHAVRGDMCVLEVAGRLPLCVVAFYIGGAAGANSGGDANKKKTDHEVVTTRSL
ncbi:hypothetical protein C3747_74g114 [Trypanosoma cruzi]|uniref:Uncharacterized protein n=1 Tax=Trypanosoma cruzi TaxID=5693 RepID=A0A2V2WMM1_TRYCR|nr:hypothetical protein C3747_74g114 [Trypanosoma cruzi]